MLPVSRFYLSKKLVVICLNELECKISKSCLERCGLYCVSSAVTQSWKNWRSMINSGFSVAFRPRHSCLATNWLGIGLQAKLQ